MRGETAHGVLHSGEPTWPSGRSCGNGGDETQRNSEGTCSHPGRVAVVASNAPLGLTRAVGTRRIGCYEILSELGSGGMGSVHAALCTEARAGVPEGARVALKVLHAHLLEQTDQVARFLREVEIGTALDHPNVVRALDGGEVDGRHYLAMELVEGRTLDALGRELGQVPEELCLHIAREVCKGLAAIHAAGAIHRDVKPANVLITPEHVVKIMDLGVARVADDALRLSQTGAFVGSLHYAAPEQFQGGGKDLDGRVDLHALGLVLYELAAGTNPYVADDLPQVVHNVLHEEPRRLGEINPQVSPWFEEVVHCMLAKDRDQRFESAEVLGGILTAGRGRPLVEGAPARSGRGRRPAAPTRAHPAGDGAPWAGRRDRGPPEAARGGSIRPGARRAVGGRGGHRQVSPRG